MKGKVKAYETKKGYGFIKANTEEYFVHYSDIISEEKFKKLNKGDIVEFEVLESFKGPRAGKVKKIFDKKDL